MPMAFADLAPAVGLSRKAVIRELARISTQTHGSAQFIDALQLAQLVNYAVRSSRIELGGVGLGKPADVACELNHHRLHSQANSEVGDLRFARVADRLQHSFDTAPAEATGNQDAVERLELGGGLRPFEFFGFDPGNVDL